MSIQTSRKGAKAQSTLLHATGIALVLLLAGPLAACNVPVFRYALERWPSDPYEVVIYYAGPLPPRDQKVVDQLKAESPANFAFRTVDLAQQSSEAQKPPELPWLVVRYPAATRLPGPAWAGPLRSDLVQTLLDSPVRREITDRILRGESAVWLLLESGKKEADDAAAALLQARLKVMQETLKLPERTDAPSDRAAGEDELPVRLAFSMLRVRRDDPAEQFLVRALLGTEPDLAGYAEPMVFPVFGRARVLYALVGAGITADNLEEAARYVIGACSCEVKRQNPGVDLLTATDWDTALQNVAKPSELPPLVGLSSFLPESAGAQTPNAAPESSSLRVRELAIGLAAGLGMLAAAVYFRRERGSRSGPA